MKLSKAVMSFIGIIIGIKVALWALHAMWFLTLILWPVIVVAGILFGVGYFAPTEVRKAAEGQIREWFDWLDFKAPSWTWPAIRFGRVGLDWLGLHIPK